MAQTVVITLTSYGADVGPLFNLYSTNQAGVTTGPFQTGLSLIQLTSGYTATNVPDDCVQVQIASTGVCTSYTSIPITGIPTPTPTPTVAPTPTPTPTPTPNYTNTLTYKLQNANLPPKNTTTNARLVITATRNSQVIPLVDVTTAASGLLSGRIPPEIYPGDTITVTLTSTSTNTATGTPSLTNVLLEVNDVMPTVTVQLYTNGSRTTTATYTWTMPSSAGMDKDYTVLAAY